MGDERGDATNTSEGRCRRLIEVRESSHSAAFVNLCEGFPNAIATGFPAVLRAHPPPLRIAAKDELAALPYRSSPPPFVPSFTPSGITTAHQDLLYV